MSDEEYEIRMLDHKPTSPASPRCTPEWLDAVAKVMREHQIVDFASGDTRVVMSSNATIPIPGSKVDPMRPIAPASTTPADAYKEAEDEEELMFAAVGGRPKP